MKRIFVLTIILIGTILLVSSCTNVTPTLSECPNSIECPKCPEKICPSCPSCEEAKQQDKPLIVEYKGVEQPPLESGYYGTYRIINPNDRKVLINIKVYCYDANDTERIYESEYFIDARSEFYNKQYGGNYFYAICVGGWKQHKIETKIID